MARKILNTFLLFLFLSISQAIAQVNPPGGCPGGCCPVGSPPGFCPAGCPDCPGVPLNGELTLLLIAGLSLVFYYFLKEKQLTNGISE
ncbi:hypothetical protein N9242_04370 [Vicingaceae bacterium]|nr:hypothetical protein [Vicingaceae bacterium]